MASYRKIYTDAYGPIPKDKSGRSYEIHHKDGNHNNNDISNLQCIPIEDHFMIHLNQCDWAACLIMSERMQISPEEKRKIASKNGKIINAHRIAMGTHNFQSSELQTAYNNIRVAKGTHHFIGESNLTHNRITNGTHNFQGDDAPSKMYWKCTNCGKEGRGKGNFTRYHLNCTILKE